MCFRFAPGSSSATTPMRIALPSTILLRRQGPAGRVSLPVNSAQSVTALLDTIETLLLRFQSNVA
jgi:hypothetical protein